jgi:hypothetical protein
MIKYNLVCPIYFFIFHVRKNHTHVPKIKQPPWTCWTCKKGPHTSAKNKATSMDMHFIDVTHIFYKNKL